MENVCPEIKEPRPKMLKPRPEIKELNQRAKPETMAFENHTCFIQFSFSTKTCLTTPLPSSRTTKFKTTSTISPSQQPPLRHLPLFNSSHRLKKSSARCLRQLSIQLPLKRRRPRRFQQEASESTQRRNNSLRFNSCSIKAGTKSHCPNLSKQLGCRSRPFQDF